jgi:hypothetical protein
MLTYRSATPSALVFPQRRSQIFSAPSSSVQSLRMLSSTQRHVLLTTMIQPLPRTLVALTPSSTLTMPRSPAYQQTTPATSSFSRAMLVESSHLSQNLTPPRPCSTSFPVTLQRWLVQKMVSRSHKQLSRLASPNPSWLFTPCDMPRCWLRRLSTTKPMPGC